MAFINWATHVYIDDRQKKQWCELSKTQKDILVELFFATQEHEAESLVMWIITYGELVYKSSTHRPYAMETILSRSYKEVYFFQDVVIHSVTLIMNHKFSCTRA